jgi:hypothetical protein
MLIIIAGVLLKDFTTVSCQFAVRVYKVGETKMLKMLRGGKPISLSDLGAFLRLKIFGICHVLCV